MTTPTGTGGPQGPRTPGTSETPETTHTRYETRGTPETTHQERYETHDNARNEKATSRVSWSGIFVGLFVTLATGMALLALGAGLGLSTVDPAAADMGTVGWGTGFWSIITVILATFIGAFVGVKVSNLRSNKDAGIQGAAIWSLSFLSMTLFAGMLGAAGAAAAMTGEAGVGTQAMQIGEAASWGYFIAAVLGAASGVLGGLAGFPAREERKEKTREERTRETRTGRLSPSEA